MNRLPPAPRAVLAVLVVLAANLGSALDAAAPAASPFKVIVNAKVAGTAVSKRVLADIYLGRLKRWGDGKPIAPVDLPSNSPLRAAFSATVLDMTLAGVRAHWMQRLTAGDRPPVARPTDAEVIAFVASQPGGIGYVSESTTLPGTVKPLAIEADADPGRSAATAPDDRARR